MFLARSASASDPLSTTDGRPLYTMDHTMRAVDETVRGLGGAGFETQVIIRLNGRIDAERLRLALNEFGRRNPIVTSRLVQSGIDAHWRFSHDAECRLHETTLAAGGNQLVLDYAATLLSAGRDLSANDPIDFRLLHQPDGRDVMLVQFNHTLMDNNGVPMLMRQINELAGRTSEEAARQCNGQLVENTEPDSDATADPLVSYLRRHSRWRRFRSAMRVLDMRFRRLRGRPLMLGQEMDDGSKPRTPTLKLTTRLLDVESSGRIQHRLREISGLGGLSMGVLASVFRTIERLSAA